MNLILFEAPELTRGELRLGGRRARHVAEVIRPAVGDPLRVGQIAGPIGRGEVLSVAADEVRLRVSLDGPAPVTPRVHLVLAVPRPKVLRRVLQTLGAMGVARLDLVNAWRVEKSFFQSPHLAPEAIRRELILGAEQGATTWLPEAHVHHRLMAYLDDPPPRPERRVVAHPRAAAQLEQVVGPGALDCLVAVGPEGGWIQREVDTFVERGHTPVSLGSAVLRTEQAVAVLLGQLSLLARL